MWVHGMRVPGALLGLVCLALVPLYLKAIWVPLLFVVTIPVAASAALGLVGNRIAVAHTGLHEPAAFSASQLPWALTGITLHTVVLPWAWYLTSASG
jgi:hypothetical protein